MSLRRGGLICICLLLGCDGRGMESGPWIAQHDTVGDSVIVRTLSGSVWEGQISLREDLRIGSLEGAEFEAFGESLEVAVAPDGSILVFDRNAPALRRFSRSGTYLGTLGREGKGPGEYGDRPNGMMVDTDGRIILSDPTNARVSAFSPEGEYLGSLGRASGLFSLFGQMLARDESGRLYLRVTTVPPGPDIPTPFPTGMEVRDSDGSVIDTVPSPSLGGERTNLFGVFPDGSLFAVSGEEPVFEIHHADGSIVRVEMPLARASYTEAELANLRVGLRPVAAADGNNEVSVPEKKPAYIDALVDASNRLWLRRPVEPRSEEDVRSVPRFQPSVLDVFERDGTYLGVVELPSRTRPVAVTDRELYVVQLGEYDEPYVVRYRLEVN